MIKSCLITENIDLHDFLKSVNSRYEEHSHVHAQTNLDLDKPSRSMANKSKTPHDAIFDKINLVTGEDIHEH